MVMADIGLLKAVSIAVEDELRFRVGPRPVPWGAGRPTSSLMVAAGGDA